MAADDTGQSAGTGTQSGTEGSTGTTDTGTQATGQPAQSGEQDGQTTASTDATVSRADFERIQNQLRAADQRRDAAEKEAQKLKDAQLTEAQRTEKALKDTQAENAQLQGVIKDLQIKNAFLTDNSHDWHDARAALKLADLSGVEITDDGTVTGLKQALDAVAKSSPYLLKTKADGETDNGKGTKQTQQQTGVTGVAGGGNGATGNNIDSLAKRFPQIMGRVSS